MNDILIPNNGAFIKGVLHSSKKTTSKTTVIFCHGFRGSMDGGGRAIVLAEKCALNYNVVRFNFSPLNTLTGQVSELLSVIKYTKENFDGKIVLLGRSMGGSSSIIAASQSLGINGLILWSTPIDTDETFSLSLGKEKFSTLKNGFSLKLDDEWGTATLSPEFYQDLLKYDLKKLLTSLPQIPLLFIHGECDEIVPLKQAELAFEIAKEPKEFALVSKGDHRFIIGSHISNQAVLDWLFKYFN